MCGSVRSVRLHQQAPLWFRKVCSDVRWRCLSRGIVPALAAAMLATATGCTTARTPIISSSLTGNWVLETTPNAGTTPFTSLAGFMDQVTQNYGVSNTVTAALEAQPSTCYLGAELIPLEGHVAGTTVGLRSFDVNGQFLTIAGTSDSTGTHLTGTYSVSGGCANGAAGSFTGVKYAIFKGTYAGTLAGSPSRSLQVVVSQNVLGTGSGTFFVSGSAALSGFSCFSSGSMASTAGSIIGNAVQLDFTTNDINGAHILLSGTIDPTASNFTVSGIQVTGGGCSGSLGSATLTLQ
jgi:hypothetical protein